MRQQRRGFTLIELLVVIGIILALIGILIMGFRHVSKAAAQKETIAELHIARGMLTEYENHNGTTFITATGSPYAGNAAIILSDLGTTNASPPPPYLGDMSSRLSGSMRYTANAVVRTQTLMINLLQIPANRTTVQSVQSKRILESQTGSAPATMDQGVVLLDGWGDPIILVPPAGMYVSIHNPTTGNYDIYVVRTSGTFIMPPSGTPPPPTPADRPFFASAGQDGDFTLGEDNVYSFQD